jgi:hypothetical protein
MLKYGSITVILAQSLLCLILIHPFPAYSQNNGKETELKTRYAGVISKDKLKQHLTIMASDSFEGRETGEKGQKMAAEYISAQFKRMGLSPGVNDTSYFQRFPLDIQYDKSTLIKLNNKEYTLNTDYLAFYGLSPGKIEAKEVVFAGFGIEDPNYSDYEKLNVKNKVVMVLDGEPMVKDSIFLVSKSKKASGWSGNYRKKEELARNKNALALLVVVSNIDSAYKLYKHRILGKSLKLKPASITTREKIPLIFISPQMANAIISNSGQGIENLEKEILKKKRTLGKIFPADLQISISVKEKSLSSENVLGYLEGTDLRDELIVVTAHYDHLGIKSGLVFNGADDDGSGTVAVIELAEAFSKAKKEGHGPRRSMLFMTFAGEEKGLLGSEYYTDNPVYLLKNTVADLNIDMIGRIDDKHKDTVNYVYIIGSDKLSAELHQINEDANRQFTHLRLDYTYNDEADPNRFYYRSDHYNFAKHLIPIIFYFNGTHGDYHRETDKINKINFELLEKRARLVFFTAWELANRNERIKLNVK